MTHYDDATLGAYVLDPLLVEDAAELETHLRACAQCSAVVDELRTLDATMREPEVWSEVDATRVRSEQLVEALALRASIVDEDRAAAGMLAHYLRSPLRFRGADISAQSRFWSAGVVRVLCSAAHTMHEKQPRFSHDVATEAWRIAQHLPKEHPSRALCAGMALRERAIALRYLGRFAEALDALAAAETLVQGTPAADAFDRALIWANRATVYMESERPREAIPLAQEAARVFRDYHDTDREIATVMVEACCHVLSGAPSRAVEGFERVIAAGRARGDNVTLVRGLHNAAVAHADLRDLDRATTYYAEAMALYDELDLPTEKTRARWGLASALVVAGELQAGIAGLAAARKELAALGLTNDAALATFEWAEARLAAGLPEGVVEACRAIVVTFGSERMERNARMALAYLNEALRKGTLTPKIVRHVREYLRDLPSEPERAFAPPA